MLGFVDVSGHERFFHDMVAGAAGIDFVLLVVAADDEPMQQTREHLQIVDLLGIERGVVALSKSDLVNPNRIAEVSAALRGLWAQTRLAVAEIVPVSIVTGRGVASLEARLLEAARIIPARLATGRFRLAIDRSFLLSGTGTVVTSTGFAGEIRVGDKVLFSPSGIAARVRRLHAQNAVELGCTGQHCSLNLVGPEVAEDRIKRGDWVLDAALHVPTDRINASVRLLPSEPRPLRHLTSVHLHMADYHKKVPDSPGLERGRLRRALEMRLPVPAFETAASAMVEDGTPSARGAVAPVTGSRGPFDRG
jgi:selenocysteine-specific elongation factor